MTHHDAWDLLDDFLDGALAADARWAVAAHLDECAVCRTQVATQARLRGLVRERLTAIEPPSGLSARVASALATEAAIPTADAVRPRLPLPIRLVVLVGPALAALWLVIAVATPVVRSNVELTRELVATHALFARDESLLDVAGDVATVTAWFQEAAGLRISAPQLDTYTLVGGRLIALEGRPVAQLVYEAESEDVYLSLLQFHHPGLSVGPILLNDGLVLNHEKSLTLVTWRSGEERLALIGTMPGEELRRLAADLAGRSDNTSSP